MPSLSWTSTVVSPPELSSKLLSTELSDESLNEPSTS